MSLATISLLSWNRFRSRSLSVVPEVVGKKHRFTYEGHKVTVSLPGLKKLTSREELRTKSDYDDVLLSHGFWRVMNNGEEHPGSYWVGAVDVVVDYPKPVTLPRGVLNQSPNAYKLLSKKRQDRLNKIVDNQKEIAERAIDYWLKVLRWKSDNSLIGRPEVRGNESGWGTYLLDANTRKKIWIGSHIILVGADRPITLPLWKKVGKLLRMGIRPPIQVDYYFDALEHLALGDLDRCVVDLAVSCEALMRGAIGSNLPPDILTSISKYVDRANINNYYEDFIPEYFKPAKKAKFRMLKKDIKDLFIERNSIVHGKGRNKTTLFDCKRFIAATQSLMSLFP